MDAVSINYTELPSVVYYGMPLARYVRRVVVAMDVCSVAFYGWLRDANHENATGSPGGGVRRDEGGAS